MINPVLRRALLVSVVSAGCLLSSQTMAASRTDQQIASLQAQTRQLSKEVAALKAKRSSRRAAKHSKTRQQRRAASNNKGFGFHGISVVTSPYAGLQSPADGSNLMVSAPSINEDLYLLNQKANLSSEPGFVYPNAPTLELSGKVEGLLHTSAGVTDASLGSSELDFNGIVSQWANAFMSLDYDPVAADEISGTTIEERSRLYVRRAYVTLGNLNQFPVYTSLGQMYVPFGSYSSALVSTASTVALAKTDSMAANIGYSHDGITVVAFGFNGRSVFDHSAVNKVDAWGANANWSGTLMGETQTVGVAYISTLADGISQRDIGTYAIVANRSNVPAFDLSANLHFGQHINLIAEYIGALKQFETRDFSAGSAFDNTPKPTALDVELGYKFLDMRYPANVYAVYDHTTQGANFSLPRDAYAGVINVSFLKNTVESLEYRHNKNYNGNENSVYLQVGAYF